MTTIPVTAISAGLTTAVTTYTSGDQMGTELSFLNAVQIAGLPARLTSLVAIDDSGVLGAFDVYLFGSATTPAADNAAASWSDADMRKCLGVVSFAAANVITGALNSVGTVPIVNLDILIPSGTTLFADMVARSANAVFAGGATSVRLIASINSTP